ncbi:DUF3885 domain-containing protein [Arundinibacter roseus]|uniref:DUF3885 domain-containing protein n=1 Tax=Arundinibacter roseus TaxID=2070510 RepID=A0A4R4KA27_9BACT|nr:DUF3885 domain-containing protein [Arundinibacter roseus]TDB64658.1 DUF3885 domain-containing protein [Arundinibacter roseus]
MSQISSYIFSQLGFIQCPSSHDFVYKSNTRQIAVYRLEENAEEFKAKKGDILVGGGRGEAQILRIALPEMIHWMNDELGKVENPETIIYPIWTPTFSYLVGEGFSKIGWKPEEKELEVWLAEKVMQDIVLKSSPVEAFRQYLATFFSRAVITESFTLGGKYELRFELGGTVRNGSKKRIKQATDRACELFREHFSDTEASIWVLAYEDLNPYFNETLNQYFPSVLKSSKLECYEEIELSCHSGSFEYHENDNSVPRFYDAKLIVAKIKIENLPIEELMRGIASFEMGHEPCISQEIYFFEAESDKAFRMYDDRGCYLWSNTKSKLESIFHSYFDWIPEYHLEEIKNQF